MRILEDFFRLKENRTSVKNEFLGGLTTFMTMSYIIFFQPALLSSVGMDRGSVMVATCLSSFLATILMGLLARYPIALAPGMGLNVFFAVTVCGTMGYSWKVGLGAVFISGVIFVIFSAVGVWKTLVASVPDSIKHAIAVGIGLFLAHVGLQYGGLVVDEPNVLVTIGDLTTNHAALAVFGIALITLLMGLRVPGAILLGIIGTALFGIPLKIVSYHGIISSPPSIMPTFLKLDILGALKTGLFSVIFIFFLIDLFDTMGTLIGVSAPAGFLKEGKLPRANRAMLSDAIGTVSGAMLGTSTVTSYIESATGIAQGARTGLASIFTSFFFLVALFFSPVAEMIGGEYIHNGLVLRPVIAPALIVVGYLMMKCVSFINWEEVTDAVPAFLTIIIMPLTLSITEGISVGFISYSFLKLATGKGKKVHWLIYFFSVLFVIRYFVK
ncbi:MAG: NCS2 family permease [Candidatus Aminicenantales bacterium]